MSQAIDSPPFTTHHHLKQTLGTWQLWGIAVGLVLRTWTVLPVRFTAVSTLSAFPVTVLLALSATLIPAWHSASASPALLRKE